MTFEEIFEKSVFIQHLTEKQQAELFTILNENCLVKDDVGKLLDLVVLSGDLQEIDNKRTYSMEHIVELVRGIMVKTKEGLGVK